MAQGGNGFSPTPYQGVKIKLLQCPTDTSGNNGGLGNPAGPDANFAISNYVWNYLVFGDPRPIAPRGLRPSRPHSRTARRKP